MSEFPYLSSPQSVTSWAASLVAVLTKHRAQMSPEVQTLIDKALEGYTETTGLGTMAFEDAVDYMTAAAITTALALKQDAAALGSMAFELVANYYDKGAADTLLAAKANTADLGTMAFQAVADFYTKTAADALLAAKADTSSLGTMAFEAASAYYTKVAADALLLAKLDASALSANGLTLVGHTFAQMRTDLGLGALALLASIATANIDNDAVTYAKLQNVVANNVLLGRRSGAGGDVEEITAAQAKTLLAIVAADVSGLGALALLSTINGSNWSGQDLAVADGGTGASTAGAALTNLGLSAVAQTLVAQTTQALMRTTGLGMSANGSSLVSASDYAAMRTLLGLVVGTDVQAFSATLAAYALPPFTVGDGAVTWVRATHGFKAKNTATLTNNRNYNFTAAAATDGDEVLISRSGGGAFNWNIRDNDRAATIATLLGTGAVGGLGDWARIRYSTTLGWRLLQQGTYA